jgi:phosphotransferase system, mannose/fructose-specific component IIA
MKILVIGHGRFAEGIKSVANIIVGDLSEVTFMNTYVDDIDFHVELDNYFSENKNVLVLTDLFGGSVNQAIIQYITKVNIDVITGINIPLILEILISNTTGNNLDFRQIISSAKEQIVYVNDMLENLNNEEGELI